MTNFNSWTWAQSDYQVTTANSEMNIGQFSHDYTSSDTSTTFAPKTGGSYLLPLSVFGFGKTDVNAGTEFYEDLMNFDYHQTYGIWANTTSLALDFRGLGLPTTEFNSFANLLSVATKGESTCLARKSGYCALTSPCSYYATTGLWDYDFKIQFTTNSDSNYIRVPLASFAANYDQEGGFCVIFVEYLDAQYDDSKTIMLGGMFFQSFYAQYTQAGINAVQIELFKNKNALDATYIGNDVLTVGDSPFVVTPAKLNTDSTSETNGLPTFSATISGITDSAQYFLLDFNSQSTIVWDKNCQTTGFGGYDAGSCELNPTLMSVGFDGPGNNLAKTGTFSDSTFGGFVVSGDTYTSQLCFGDINCKYINVHSATQVSQDNWLFNNDATYGIIGMGPGSFIWEGFVDPDTKLAFYSIELARVSFYGEDEIQGATVKSNITFGEKNDAPYQGNPQIYMSAQSDYTFGLLNFAYGIVYTENGASSSEFFYDLGTTYPVTFNTNFKGLGLPSSIYANFVTLITYVTENAVSCSNTVDGICTLPGPCSNYTELSDYYFRFNFTTEYSGNYMRVPLSTFAEKRLVSGDETCNINVNYLDTNAAESSSINLGGMFFQEFFGVFTNGYQDVSSVD